MFVAGMWFQTCSTTTSAAPSVHHPVCDTGGEISFCAYNTGVGWRNIIEKMHMTATLTKWYEEHGRHEIFAVQEGRDGHGQHSLNSWLRT
jgi:pyocin large subunit-like protein